MRKTSQKPDLPSMNDLPRELCELNRLISISDNTTPRLDSIISDVVRSLSKKNQPTDNDSAAINDEDKAWCYHKLFAQLHEKYGRPFRLFVGDILDILIGGTSHNRFLNELIEDYERRRIVRASALSIDSIAESKENKGAKLVISPKTTVDRSIQIGGEPLFKSRSFLKRKAVLASVFLDSEEYPSFLKLLKHISNICHEEMKNQAAFVVPNNRSDQQAALRLVIEELKTEMTREGLIRAWMLLEAGDFQDLEWVFNETRSFGLVRPTFYDDLDKAYREAKKMLKLLIAEFEGPAGGANEKHETILQYLKDILEVFTHHHFVIKHFNQTRPSISRAEFEKSKRDWQGRIESLRAEIQGLRDTIQKVSLERDQAIGENRILRQENQEMRLKLQKLDPVQVQKQLQAMESRMNQAQRERDELKEEVAELHTALRNLDIENQRLTQMLRDLKAIPDETAKSVEGLLKGKRVVIFGGVGRDHYWPVLEEAGVKESDYEWYEGYHTISQSRTAEIVGRCDVIVVVTRYAGHLHTWQTRNTVGPHQTLLLIHSSGAGSLRQKILEEFKNSPPPQAGG